MKALLLKDFYILQKSMRTLIIIILFYGAFGIFTNQYAFVTSMIAIFGAIAPLSTYSYDDFSKWNNYALSMPLTRNKIVYAKYLISILMLLAGSVCALILSMIASALNGSATGSVIDIFVSVGVVFSLGLLMISIILPVILKLGVEKGRIAMIAIFLVPAAIVMLLVKMPVSDWIPTEIELESLIKMAVILTPVVAVLILALSILISVRIFSKKEF